MRPLCPEACREPRRWVLLPCCPSLLVHSHSWSLPRIWSTLDSSVASRRCGGGDEEMWKACQKPVALLEHNVTPAVAGDGISGCNRSVPVQPCSSAGSANLCSTASKNSSHSPHRHVPTDPATACVLLSPARSPGRGAALGLAGHSSAGIGTSLEESQCPPPCTSQVGRCSSPILATSPSHLCSCHLARRWDEPPAAQTPAGGHKTPRPPSSAGSAHAVFPSRG